MEIPGAKIFVCRSIFYKKNIYRSVIIKVNMKSSDLGTLTRRCFILTAVFVCVTKNTQTNCQYVSSQFIASKTQETHSRGNTVDTLLGGREELIRLR